MNEVAAKINALIKANLALHVARTAPNMASYRAEFTARQEAEVAHCQEDLSDTLNAIFYPES